MSHTITPLHSFIVGVYYITIGGECILTEGAYVDRLLAYQSVEPRVRGVEVRPEYLETHEARECKDARHRRLRRVLRRDEDEYSRKQDAPPTLDHLEIVQLRTCATRTCGWRGPFKAWGRETILFLLNCGTCPPGIESPTSPNSDFSRFLSIYFEVQVLERPAGTILHAELSYD